MIFLEFLEILVKVFVIDGVYTNYSFFPFRNYFLSKTFGQRHYCTGDIFTGDILTWDRIYVADNKHFSDKRTSAELWKSREHLLGRRSSRNS